jgi:hypothetical protein
MIVYIYKWLKTCRFSQVYSGWSVNVGASPQRKEKKTKQTQNSHPSLWLFHNIISKTHFYHDKLRTAIRNTHRKQEDLTLASM